MRLLLWLATVLILGVCFLINQYFTTVFTPHERLPSVPTPAPFYTGLFQYNLSACSVVRLIVGVWSLVFAYKEVEC